MNSDFILFNMFYVAFVKLFGKIYYVTLARKEYGILLVLIITGIRKAPCTILFQLQGLQIENIERP